jgi:aminopeptidase-like protein
MSLRQPEPDQQRIKRMLSLAEEIAPLPRMVNCPGLDQAFAILAASYPGAVLHEYPTGATAEDWIVPQAWTLRQGSLRDTSGRVLASTEECPLFVAPYSEPVDGWFTKEEIALHLRTRPDRPQAFSLEHRYAYDYRLKDWGITLPHARWQDMPEGSYHVRIETNVFDHAMKVGEWTLPGETDNTILLTAHIDELCNDDLSGCLVGLEIMRALEKLPKRRNTYRLILAPEMFGTIFYAHANPQVLARTEGMLNFEALGAGEALCAKSSLKGASRVDAALCEALDSLGLAYRALGFFEGYGNDERVLEWPSVGIPSAALQRHPFAQYHTSDDVPELLDGGLLEQAVQAGIRFAQILEADAVPRFSLSFQPWLTRRGLYLDRTTDQATYHKLCNLVLFHVDGRHSLLDLARLSGLHFDDVRTYLDAFAEQGVLRYEPVCPAPRSGEAER